MNIFKLSKFLVFVVFVFLFLILGGFEKNNVFAVDDVTAADGCSVDMILIGTGYIYGPNAKNSFPACSSIQTSTLGFRIPSLGDILTFAIRVFFVIAGISALFYMLAGAFTWVTSGGEEEAVTKAREKIQAAVLGMILIVGVLAIIWTLEQVIFNRRICLGLSCTLTLPGLVKVTEDGAYCCVCVNQSTNARGQIINTSNYRCNDEGKAAAL